MTKANLTSAIHRVLHGGPCPICGYYFEPNGTGPESSAKIRFVLKFMPWDKILQELAVPMHDWRCHIGEHETNLSFEDTTKEFRKNVREAVYRWCTKPWRPWRRLFYKPCFSHLDEVYAFAVGKTSFGKKAYDSNSCLIK